MQEPYSLNPKEVKGPPSINIIIPNASQARILCSEVRDKVAEWKEKGYGVSSPPEFSKYLEGKMKDEDFDKVFNKWFESWNPEPANQAIESCRQAFQSGTKAYQSLQEWGFFIPNQYNVVITPCAIGAGGSYDLISPFGPRITMYYDRKWENDVRTPQECLLHEAYHMGVEEIILRLGLNQKEKERTVDICSQEVLVPLVLPQTFVQRKDERMPIDPYLALKQLSVPDRLQRFIASRV